MLRTRSLWVKVGFDMGVFLFFYSLDIHLVRRLWSFYVEQIAIYKVQISDFRFQTFWTEYFWLIELERKYKNTKMSKGANFTF
jgi:hypothetical protein